MNDQSNQGEAANPPENPTATSAPEVAMDAAQAEATPVLDSAGTEASGLAAATPNAAEQVLENALRGAAQIIESMIRQLEVHVPEAAQFLHRAVDEIRAKCK